MKKVLILGIFVLFLIINFCGFSQEEPKMMVDINSSFSKVVTPIYSNQIYGNLGVDLGVQFQDSWGQIVLTGCYQFYSNVNYFNTDGKAPNTRTGSFLRNHFIGGAISFTFFNEEKKFRPFISIKGVTEIATNYKNNYLTEADYIPIDKPAAYKGPTGSHGSGPDKLLYYYSNFYYSTPFVGSVIAGCDFRLMKDLHLNLGVGYCLRIMKTKYAEWGENDDIDEILRGKTPTTHYFHMLDVQLGLTYTFSFHKNEKPQPE